MDKILHIVDGLDPSLGGVAKAVESMVNGLEDKSYTNHILSLDNERHIQFSEEKTKLFIIGEGKGPWNYNNKLKTWLSSNFKEYAVVILHGLWLHKNFCAYQIFKKQINTELFIMPHGMLDPYFQDTDSRKLKALRNKLYWQFIEKHIINNSSGLLFTCEEEKLLARTTFTGYNPKKEHVVSLGVEDIARSLQINNDPISRLPYYLYLSRIHEKKGLDLLVSAYKKLIEDTNVDEIPQLIIAGPGEDSAFGQALKNKIHESPILLEKIKFVGLVLGQKKVSMISNAELFILPSHQENFGIAIVEALACSTPVLISDKVNIWREIKEGGGGIIAEDNHNSVDIHLKQWFDLAAAKKEDYSKNARLSYERYFTIPAATDKLLNALRRE